MTINTPVARRRGRPPAANPLSNRRMANLREAEGRMLNAWMRQHGITTDTEALRTIVLERLAAEGIEDPGPDSEEGKPLTSPWRQTTSTTSTDVPRQLQLSA